MPNFDFLKKGPVIVSPLHFVYDFSRFFLYLSEADLEGGAGGACPPFFCNYLFFCNHFEELQTVIIEVKLVINNAPATSVYSNTIKTCLTPNHLLFGYYIILIHHHM